MNKSKLFKKMWEMIKEFGMSKSEALKKAWTIMKGEVNKVAETAKSFVEKALEKGDRWTKGKFDRIYFNWKEMGLNVEYYNSGNICSADFNGKEISNSCAKRILCAKIYLDLNKENKLFLKNTTMRIDDEDTQEIFKYVRNWIEA